jgi:hypothetical protein
MLFHYVCHRLVRRHEYGEISIAGSSIYFLTFSSHALNSHRLPSSFFACLSCSSSSLILASFSSFWWNKYLRFHFFSVMNIVLIDSMESGYFLTSSATLVSVMNDNGFPLLIKPS